MENLLNTYSLNGGGYDRYELSGWSYSANNEPVEGILENVNSDLTVYACYLLLPNQYWYNADGSLLAVTHYKIGSTAVYPNENPQYTGANWPFTGWNSDLVVNAQEMSFYAQYAIPTGWETDTTWEWVRDKIDAGDTTDLLNKRFLLPRKSGQNTVFHVVGVKTSTGADIDCVSYSVNDTSTSNAGLWTDTSNPLRSKVLQFPNIVADDVKERMVTTTRHFINVMSNGLVYKYSDENNSWAPNFREMNTNDGNSAHVASSGPSYSSVYNSDTKRIKRNISGTAVSYFIRDNHGNGVPFVINESGKGWQLSGSNYVAYGISLKGKTAS